MKTLFNLQNLFAFFAQNEQTQLIYEIVGIVASALVLISFVTNNRRVMRIISLAGAVVFVVYGILLPSYSVATMNTLLIGVNIFYLVRDEKQRRSGKNQQQDSSNDDDESSDLPQSSCSAEQCQGELTSGGTADAQQCADGDKQLDE